jgi:ABC-2 type transport system ATP-binding protein
VFLSSHLMTEMASTADQLVVIGQGRLIAAQSLARFAAHSPTGSLEEAFMKATAGSIEFPAGPSR